MRRKDQPPDLAPGDRVRHGRDGFTVTRVYWRDRFGWTVSAHRKRGGVGSCVTGPLSDFRWEAPNG